MTLQDYYAQKYSLEISLNWGEEGEPTFKANQDLARHLEKHGCQHSELLAIIDRHAIPLDGLDDLEEVELSLLKRGKFSGKEYVMRHFTIDNNTYAYIEHGSQQYYLDIHGSLIDSQNTLSTHNPEITMNIPNIGECTIEFSGETGELTGFAPLNPISKTKDQSQLDEYDIMYDALVAMFPHGKNIEDIFSYLKKGDQ